MKKVIFIIPPSVELLDLAGPVQVFTEAKFYDFKINIEFYASQPDTITAPGLLFDKLVHYKNAILREGDFIFIPGMEFESLKRFLSTEKDFFKWLSGFSNKKVNICAICNASFILGKAGLLNNRKCTTHWRRIDLLQKLNPNAKVLTDVLFVKSDNIYTSAGISAGIDLALSILEELTTPLFVNKVARGLVVYHRRNSIHTQQSIYLDYRSHVNPKVHKIQDFLIENMSTEISIDKLASIVYMSPRNLSRVFKVTTNISIIAYLTKLRLEKAKILRNNPEYTLSYIASECGFKSSRQLQRILKKAAENEK